MAEKQSLYQRAKKSTIINSKYYNDNEVIPFDAPILNLACNGSLHGGLPAGILMIAAPPKHFKSSLMIQAMQGFQKKYSKEENLIIFYDSEFGTPDEYFVTAGVDVSLEKFDRRPVLSVEEFRSDIANLLEGIEQGDRILICLDSLGMLPSSKEIKDAKEESEKADMTRAKVIKSVFRIVNPQLSLKGIPMIVINHTYQTMDMYPEEVAGGGRGAQYAGHTLWNMGKRMIKEGGELTGHDFVVRAKFSRYVREKSEFPITVSYEDGIKKYSGLFDLAFDNGFIKSEKQGWYIVPHKDKACRRAELEEDATFMESLLADKGFCDTVESRYKL